MNYERSMYFPDDVNGIPTLNAQLVSTSTARPRFAIEVAVVLLILSQSACAVNMSSSPGKPQLQPQSESAVGLSSTTEPLSSTESGLDIDAKKSNVGSAQVSWTVQKPGQNSNQRTASSTTPSLASKSAGKPAQSSIIDLSETITHAQTADAEFKIARQRHEVVAKNIDIAKSAFGIKSNLDYAAGYNNFSNDSSDDYIDHGIELALVQPLYDRTASIDIMQANLNHQLSSIELQAAQQSLYLRASSAYINVKKAEEELAFRQRDVDAIEDRLGLLRNLYQAGSIPITDVSETQARYDLARSTQVTAENQLATTREAFALVTGLDSSVKLASVKSDIPLLPADTPTQSEWISTALKNNKALLVARDSANIARTQIVRSKARRLPKVAVSGVIKSINTQFDQGVDSSGGRVQFGVNVPLLTGGFVSATVAADRAIALQADEQVDSIEGRTIQHTRDAYRSLLASIARIDLLDQALVSTAKAAEATQQGFEVGSRSSLELLESLRNTFQVKAEHSIAGYDYLLNRLKLAAVSGTLNTDDVANINTLLE